MKILAECDCHINYYERKAKKTLIKSNTKTFKPQILKAAKKISIEKKISVATAFAYFCGFSFCVVHSLVSSD